MQRQLRLAEAWRRAERAALAGTAVLAALPWLVSSPMRTVLEAIVVGFPADIGAGLLLQAFGERPRRR